MSDNREPVRTGLIGAGGAAALHLRALERLPGVDVVAVADTDREAATVLAQRFEIDCVLDSHEELLGLDLDAVHNCTSNTAHAAINAAVLEARCHLLAEKPLAISSAESRELVIRERAAASAGVVAAVCFTRRHLPAIKQLRQAVASHRHGPLHHVRAGYAQDWFLPRNVWNWRFDPALSGPSATVADLGSHVFDLVEHLAGERVARVVADLGTLHSTRLAGDPPVARSVTTEDHASILARLESGVQVLVSLSQVSAGHRNQFSVELSLGDATLAWSYEDPTVIRTGLRGRGFAAEAVSDSEGEAFVHAVSDFYRAVRGGDRLSLPLASFADGHHSVCLVEAILASHRSRTWSAVLDGPAS